MESIQKHIDHNNKILENPTTSPQQRRYTRGELNSLIKYQESHPEDTHDPSPLELYCNEYPSALECKIYES
jgi:hypothetical protein